MNDIRPKKVLVTGATGLIGSHLVERLLDDGHEVTAMGRNGEKLRLVFKDRLASARFSCIPGNIADGFPKSVEDIDLIFHAASPVSGHEIRSLPVDAIGANLAGLGNCLEYLAFQKEKHARTGRLVVFSSATVYGNGTDADRTADEEETGIAEPLHCPSSPYSESKRMAEVMAGAYGAQYGTDSVIARIGYVYGHSRLCPDTAFYELLDSAVSGRDLVLRNAGMARRDNIYVRDAVNALVLLGARGKTGESYNVASCGEKGNFKAIDEIAQMIAESASLQLGRPVRTILPAGSVPRRPGVMLDNRKLKALGWSLGTGLREGIDETVSNHIKRGI